MTFTRIVAILAALVGALGIALVISGCTKQPASDGHTDHDHGGETAEITAEPAGFNADDVSFATGMIPHHEQAVELAALVPDRSTNPEVIALATQISGAQEPEINTMKAFLVQWNENPGDETANGGHAGHGGMAMSGMVDDTTMTKLETLKGAEFDTLWLQSMISHHQGAIEMAKAEVANGQNVDAKQLAQTIIDAQQAEITQMQKMLGSNP
jgi:uncharacterized protein (DUF305 family)